MLPPLWTEQPLPPPGGGAVHSWDLESLAQLAQLRAELRDLLAVHSATPPADSAAAERLVLTVDELASNGLRHGRRPVRAHIAFEAACWLVDVSDAAASRAPHEALDRDLGHGGMGLYLIAAFTDAHGWHVDGDRKHVWATVPHDLQLPSEPVLPEQRLARACRTTGYDPEPG